MADKEKYLREAQYLYVKYCESYQSWQKVAKTSDSLRKVESKLIKTKNISDLLIKCTESLNAISRKNSDEQKRFTIMLAYALNCKLEWMSENHQQLDEAFEYYEKIVKLLEPYAKDPMVLLVRLYTCNLIYKPGLAGNNRSLQVNDQKMDVLECIKQQVGVEKNKFWKGVEVFGVPADQQSDSFNEYQGEHHVREILRKSMKESRKVTHKSMEISENLLKQMPTYSQIAENLKSENIIDKMQALNWINKRIDHLLNLGKFKQAHHIISVGFFHSVKMRRNLAPEVRSSMNVVQGALSGYFALYGNMLITGMHSEMKGNSLKRDDEFTELTECLEEGLEVYSSQFPVDYPSHGKETKKVLKRAVVWADRAIMLLNDHPEMLQEMYRIKHDIEQFLNSYTDYF